MELIFASHNENKCREIRALLPNYTIKSLKELDYSHDIPETGSSLKENAAIKAWTIFKKFHLPVFADDTGLIVPALNGAPGVYSARYAGPQANAESNMAKLLLELRGEQNRGAYFETLICYINSDGDEFYFSGKVEGEILESPRGSEGFGYDPIFKPDGEEISFAEMPSAIKNRMSHRGRALEKFIHYLHSS